MIHITSSSLWYKQRKHNVHTQVKAWAQHFNATLLSSWRRTITNQYKLQPLLMEIRSTGSFYKLRLRFLLLKLLLVIMYLLLSRLIDCFNYFKITVWFFPHREQNTDQEPDTILLSRLTRRRAASGQPRGLRWGSVLPRTAPSPPHHQGEGGSSVATETVILSRQHKRSYIPAGRPPQRGGEDDLYRPECVSAERKKKRKRMKILLLFLFISHSVLLL